MMKQVNIYEAKTQLSRLVDEAANGEDIIIARAGKPAARLTRVSPGQGRRKLGVLDGQFKIPDDFNCPLPEEIISAFEGGS
jgi:prevent-host-death family protein